jgi:hypothetical protein
LIWAVNDRERPDFKSIPHFGYWDTGPGSSDHLRWTTIVRSAPYYPTVVALDLSALAAGSVHRVGEVVVPSGSPSPIWPSMLLISSSEGRIEQGSPSGGCQLSCLRRAVDARSRSAYSINVPFPQLSLLLWEEEKGSRTYAYFQISRGGALGTERLLGRRSPR